MAETFVPPTVEAHAMTLDARWYTSADDYRREQELIFGRDWICVGHEGSIEQAGDYLTATVAGESIMIVRDGSGAVRAFYNVCRHRGTQLCTEATGHVLGSIQCPYHAWTYALDGALLAARNMQGNPGFDRADYPLHSVAVTVVEGFIFVTLWHEPNSLPPPLEALAAKLQRWGASELREAQRIDYDVACNWKLLFQNYSECYHCPVIHPQLERLSPSDSGRNDFVSGSILGGYSELREHDGSLTTTGKRRRAPLGSVDGPDLERDYYYTIFPSMLLSLHADYLMIHLITPVAANRSRISCQWLFDPKVVDQPSFDPSDVVEFWDLTNRQDWSVSELTQRGISSRAYRRGPYAQAEGLLHAFDVHYLSVMGA